MQSDLAELESRLWDAADELRANSGLKASEYGAPVLGLIFLRFAEARFEAAREEIESKASARRKIGPSDYQAQGLIYLAPEARFSELLDLPEVSDLGKAVNDAMRFAEEHNPELSGVLPRRYAALDNALERGPSVFRRDCTAPLFVGGIVVGQGIALWCEVLDWPLDHSLQRVASGCDEPVDRSPDFSPHRGRSDTRRPRRARRPLNDPRFCAP